jgi:hypothetical protein
MARVRYAVVGQGYIAQVAVLLPVRLGPFARTRRPGLAQDIRRPPVRKPPLVRAQSPSAE